MMNHTPKRVVVVGDVTIDWNVGRLPSSQDTTQSWNSQNLIRASVQRGGAAFIAELVEELLKLDLIRPKGYALTSVDVPANDDDLSPNDRRYHHSYARWELYPYEQKDSGGKGDTYAWRVKDFIGLQQRKEIDQRAVWREALRRLPEADIIVLDDAALGFREQKNLWKDGLRHKKPGAWIVVKMARPVAAGTLWKQLHAKHAERLVAVVTADDLRLTSAAAISRELSWERTAQDLAWELQHNPALDTLSLPAHVIVTFATAGAFLLSRQPLREGGSRSRLFFDPQTIERTWAEKYPGGMIGYTSCMVAGVVYQLMLNPDAPNMPQGIRGGLAAMQKLLQEGFGKYDGKKKDPSPELKLNKGLIIRAASNYLEKESPFVKNVLESLQEKYYKYWESRKDVTPPLRFSAEFILKALRRAARATVLDVQVDNLRDGKDAPAFAGRFLGHLRAEHRSGAGGGHDDLPFSLTEISEILREAARRDSTFVNAEVRDPTRPADEGYAASGGGAGAAFWTLLGDQCRGGAAGDDGLNALAEEIVSKGAKKALKEVPLGEFGKLLTVDRREIESYRSVRSLMLEYVSKEQQERPLSIAVFGPPGSGKSFGVGQVAEAVLGNRYRKLTFNLSQFQSPAELLGPLHQIRDVSLKGFIPLVFWDEFDTSLGEPLGWLRYFLAPMQDGEFQQGEITHPIGRAIFVFAGGTSETVEGFASRRDPDQFRAVKGPDFVSRLKGYIDIMGPNPKGGDISADPSYVIRRAILLRSILERSAPNLFTAQGAKPKLNIDRGVRRAFLRIPQYRHGARSMESLIAMSRLAGKSKFEPSALPAEAQLDLHVNGRLFLALIGQAALDTKDDSGEETPERKDMLERLAAIMHDTYRIRLKARGQQTENSKLPYKKLKPEEQRQNFEAVQAIPQKLEAVGYVMAPARGTAPPADLAHVVEQLAQMEHERWLKSKLVKGWSYAKDRDDKARKHPALLLWDWPSPDFERRYSPEEQEALGRHRLPEIERDKNRDQAIGISRILGEINYTVLEYKRDPTGGTPGPAEGRRRVRVGVIVRDSQADPALVSEGVEKALRRIEEVFHDCALTAVSNLNERLERLIAAHILSRPEAQLLAVLPLPRSAFLDKLQPRDVRVEVSHLLQQSSEVVSAPMSDSPQAAHTNVYLEVLRRSDVLIVVGVAPETPQKDLDEAMLRAIERAWPIAWVSATDGQEDIRFDYLD